MLDDTLTDDLMWFTLCQYIYIGACNHLYSYTTDDFLNPATNVEGLFFTLR